MRRWGDEEGQRARNEERPDRSAGPDWVATGRDEQRTRWVAAVQQRPVGRRNLLLINVRMRRYS